MNQPAGSISKHDSFHPAMKPNCGSRACAGAAVVDAVLDLAADGDLHRLGDRHGAQAGEPLGNYVNQFGPFWAAAVQALKLNTVYSAWWFLLILAFLVTAPRCASRATRPRSWRT
jgi:hypothetical protein